MDSKRYKKSSISNTLIKNDFNIKNIKIYL